jgi:hypothetical protein
VVYLEIIGRERTKWHSQEGSGGKKHKSKHLGKNDLLVSRSVIQAFPGGEAPVGSYTFPFTFPLPEWLPSSMVYFGPQKSGFQIKYKVKVRMEENAESSQSTIKPVIAKKRITVHRPITEP